MIQTVRKVVFWVFFALYLAVCPVLILYSLGYIFNPAYRQMTHTGLIYVASQPAGAHVFLGGSHYSYLTPTSITGLRPGTYDVMVRRKGYRPWRTKVTIEAGKAAVFDSVLLLPEKVPTFPHFPDMAFSRLAALPETPWYLLAAGPRLGDYYLFDREKGKLDTLLPEGSSFAEFPVDAVYAADTGASCVVYGGSLWDKKYLFVEPGEKRAQVREVTRLFAGRPRAIVWAPAEKGTAFALFENTIDRLDLAMGGHFPGYLEHVKGFGVAGSWWYAVTDDGLIYRSSFDKKKASTVFKDRGPGPSLFAESGFYEIKVLDADVLFRGTRGDLVLTVPPYRIPGVAATGSAYYRKLRRLAYWDAGTVGVATLPPWDAPEQPFENRLVYRKGKGITQCLWAYDGTHLLAAEQDKVTLLELLPGADAQAQQLVSIRANSAIAYDDDTGLLYYLDPQGRLMSAAVVPR